MSCRMLLNGKLVVKLVREQRVGQLPEVCFAQGADAVDVLQVHFLAEVRGPVALKLTPVCGGDKKGHRCDGEWAGEELT